MPADTSLPATPITNTARSYGMITKIFHWLTALLILTAIPLGLVANQLPYDTAEQLALKAQIFSLHKTIGVAAFFVALARILWAVTQTKPSPLHPERKLEGWLAETVHWSLYGALVVVPLSGWVHHAASQGFAPILWPFGQGLPLIPQSQFLYDTAGSIHWIFTKVLAASLLLHIAGAVKHATIDRDITLQRMWFTRADTARVDPGALHSHGPAIMGAGVIYALGFVAAIALISPKDAPGIDAPALSAAEGGNWQVQQGEVAIGVTNFGSTVSGSFADWTARIAFAETPVDGVHGEVEVQISIPTLTLGQVTAQALGADYFNAETYPTATFTAQILPGETGYLAEGTLDLAGQSVPVTLPFTLTIDGDTAVMEGQTRLDRRDFAIGEGTTDEATLGFGVDVTIALTAQRNES